MSHSEQAPRIEPLAASHPDAIAAVTRYLAEITGLGAVCGQAPADDPDDLAKLSPPGGAFLVARDGVGGIVGCGGLRTLSPGVGEIKRMWVDGAVRGRGVARRLLGALEDTARDLGHHTLRLDTSDVLDAAIALYHSSGFVAIERYNDNPDAKCFFEKSL